MTNDNLEDLLSDADRVASVDLYPSRCRDIIAKLSAALKSSIADLDESRNYGLAVDQELRDRSDQTDRFVEMVASMDEDFQAAMDEHTEMVEAVEGLKMLRDNPMSVYLNMLHGAIAKPTVDQIIHLYGVDEIYRHLRPRGVDMPVDVRFTWAKDDQEFWLHMKLPDGKSAGINLGNPNTMIATACLRALTEANHG